VPLLLPRPRIAVFLARSIYSSLSTLRIAFCFSSDFSLSLTLQYFFSAEVSISYRPHPPSSYFVACCILTYHLQSSRAPRTAVHASASSELLFSPLLSSLLPPPLRALDKMAGFSTKPPPEQDRLSHSDNSAERLKDKDLEGQRQGLSDSDSGEIGRQIELEAENSIKYRTCSWQKVCCAEIYGWSGRLRSECDRGC
jgi:hypothetical protein